jgi:glycine/D-amino acid oxidase-like deaminating enzyme
MRLYPTLFSEAGMREECFWMVEASAVKGTTEKPLPSSTDIVVIGGGFTGTSAALRLAKSGARVTLLEAHNIGWGASGRNGGQSLSCLHRSLTRLVELFGREEARAMYQASFKACDTVERIVSEENIDCDYSRSGNIEAASKPAHFEALKREQETLASVAGYEVRLLPKDRACEELGTGIYHGLMVNERSASLQPAKYVQGLAAAAERAGADVHEGMGVIGIERVSGVNNGYKFHVKTDRGTLSAKEIFLAANAWAGEIMPAFKNKIIPAESFIIATRPLPEELARRLIPNKRVVYDTNHLLAYYKLSADNLMVFGVGHTTAKVKPEKNIETLRRSMARVFPELSDAQIDFYWSGTLGLTLDENTHAGQVDGIWYSMCYVGHGVAMGTYMGEQMANAILGRESDNPFGKIKIPVVPFYKGQAWFENLGKAWFWFQDKLG